MKYYGKFNDEHDLITVKKGGQIAQSEINLSLQEGGAIAQHVATHGGKIDEIQVAGTTQTIVNKVVNIPTVDNLTSAESLYPLTAKQGKVLNDRIDSLEGIGRYLALWDCTTGLPTTDPSLPEGQSSYTYRTGDYYRVSAVQSGNNLRPYGPSYTPRQASTTAETGDVQVGDVYFYDGSNWSLQINHISGLITDVKVNDVSVVSGSTALIDISGKQDTITAGTGLSKSGATLNHSNSVTAGTASEGGSARTLAFGGTFNVPSVTYDAQGHVTAKGSTTLTMPANPNTDTKVTMTANTANVYYISGSTSSGTNTGTQYFNANIKGNCKNSSGTVEAGSLYASKMYGAVWNDFAEYRKGNAQPGACVCEVGDGSLKESTERLQAGASIVSDTFGFAIGETEECKLPIAVAGRVLAYYGGEKSDYKPGDAVCAGPFGRVWKMTREEIKEYPDRIVGYVSEFPTYDTWGSGNIKINNRFWIKVK